MTKINLPDASLTAHQLQALWQAARAAQAKAYAPYSRYQVGVAVLDEHGGIHSGCNVENAAYPQGWCAEASALGALVLAGAARVRAVLLTGSSSVWVTPCGGCRQKLREFADPDTPVYTSNTEAIGPVYLLGDLLPNSFGPNHLNAP